MCLGIYKFLFGDRSSGPELSRPKHEYKKPGNEITSTVIDAEFSGGNSQSSDSDSSSSSTDEEQFGEQKIFMEEEQEAPKDEEIIGETTGNVDLLDFDVVTNHKRNEETPVVEKKRFGANKHENFKKKGKTMMKKRKLKVKKKPVEKKTEVE